MKILKKLSTVECGQFIKLLYSSPSKHSIVMRPMSQDDAAKLSNIEWVDYFAESFRFDKNHKQMHAQPCPHAHTQSHMHKDTNTCTHTNTHEIKTFPFSNSNPNQRFNQWFLYLSPNHPLTHPLTHLPSTLPVHGTQNGSSCVATHHTNFPSSHSLLSNLPQESLAIKPFVCINN